MRQEAIGLVLEAGRGSLPYALVHGEPLVACAAMALDEAGVGLADGGTPWRELASAGVPIVLHDPLCPLVPPGFIAECLLRSLERDRVVVAVRPVTDTVKQVGEHVGATVDRDRLLQVVSPLVLPASVAVAIEDPGAADLAELTAWLAERLEVDILEAPVDARRIASKADLLVLEALTTARSARRTFLSDRPRA